MRENRESIKNTYTFSWSNYQSFLTLEMNLLAFRDFRDNEWNQSDNIIEFSNDNLIKTFHSNKDLGRDRERGRRFLDKKYVKDFFDREEKSYKESWDFFNKLKSIKYSELANKDLTDLLLEAVRLWCVQIGYFRASQEQGTYYLINEIRKNFSDEEVSLLLISPELDIINKESMDWEKLAKEPYSRKNMIAHMEKYPWVVAAHFTLEDCVETLKSRYNSKLISNRNIFEEKIKLKDKQNKLIEKADKNLLDSISTLQKLALSRASVKSCWAGTDFYFISLFEEISKRSGENILDINKFYLKDEIIKLLCNGEIISKEEKEKRKRMFVGLWKNNELIFKSGADAEKLIREEISDLYETRNINEIKGAAANGGKFIGIARILGSNNMEKTRDFRNTFKEGEILVTEMTQPNIVDIASRAGAIITDEGGMLSHAAIISREFKIPCIVGTKIATQVLKDGDLVEVDANAGVVKILKRADEN